MNPPLIARLSLFGLVMGTATIKWIPTNVEPFCWLAVFLVSAYFLAKNLYGKPFQNGVCVGLANCVWVTGAHIVFAETYLANHPAEAEQLTHMPAPDSPRLMMLMMGPVIGLISGLVIGLLGFVAQKILQP